MPITKPRRPLAIVTGQVIAIEKKPKYDDNGRPTGDVDRHDVTIFQASHATPDVRFPFGADSVPVPEKGEHVALIVDIGETREYGANLRVVRRVTDEDLESVARLLPAVATK